MTTNTARSRFADTRFSWWVGVGAVNDDRQASARLVTAQPGTRFLCAVPPVRASAAGSDCHAVGFFERIASDLVSADSPAAGEPAVRSAKHISEPTMGVVVMGHSLSAAEWKPEATGGTHSQSALSGCDVVVRDLSTARIRALEAELNRLKGAA